MEYNFKTWPYKWFGLWKEYGDQYQQYPSVYNFVNSDVNSMYDKKKLHHYLSSGLLISSTSGLNFRSPFDDTIIADSVSFRTDGTWLWLDNISKLIELNDLIIPEELYKEIQANNFTVPKDIIFNENDFTWPE